MFVLRWYDAKNVSNSGKGGGANGQSRIGEMSENKSFCVSMPEKDLDLVKVPDCFFNNNKSPVFLSDEVRGASLTECWHFRVGSAKERVRKIGGWGYNPFGRERREKKN